MKRILHAMEIEGVLHRIRLSEPTIHADNEACGRSGHLGHAMTEFSPGRIVVFSENSSGKRLSGHTGYGWMDYRISEDYGETFGEAKKFPFSWSTFLDGERVVAVEKAVTLNDGSVAAFCLIGFQTTPACWEPTDIPVVVLSRDGCESWEAPVQVSPYAGRIYDVLYQDGIVYVMQLCNDARENFTSTKPEHLYRLFRSTDGCKTFEEVSTIPFGLGRGYGNMIFTPQGDLIAYAYNLSDEYNMDYAISHDLGKTWDEVGTSYVANRIRNPQVGLLDGQYILHGRAGENEGGTFGGFVLYTSADGIHWDEGHILVSGRPACFYSNNLTVTLPDGHKRMLVKYSENYRDPCNEWSGCVNSMLLYIETV